MCYRLLTEVRKDHRSQVKGYFSNDDPGEKIEFDLREVLKRNPRIDKSVVQKYQELEKKLEKLGVDMRPHYTLSPPLGDSPTRRLHNRTR